MPLKLTPQLAKRLGIELPEKKKAKRKPPSERLKLVCSNCSRKAGVGCLEVGMASGTLLDKNRIFCNVRCLEEWLIKDSPTPSSKS